jgi:MFS family permease
VLLLTERARPEVVRRSRRAPWLAVGAVCLGAFMGQLDASVVTLTFPALRHEFHTSLAAVSWVSLAYLITLVALLVPVGRVSDSAGRKLVYLLGFLLFTVASAGCGLAPTLGVLVAGRVVQAAGAAMLQANSVALITTATTDTADGAATANAGPGRRGTGHRLRAALGVQAAAQALGLALGPAVGGLLVAGPGWRWVFMINIPVGVIALVAGRYLLPRTRQRVAAVRFDRVGLGLLAVAAVSGLAAISAVSGLAVPWWGAVALGVAALAAVALFRWYERRAADPLVPPGLLAGREVATGLGTACAGYLVLFGPLVIGPVALAGSGGAAGLYLTALPAGFAVAALVGGRVLPRNLSNRARGTAGLAVAAVALIALALVPVGGGSTAGGLWGGGFVGRESLGGGYLDGMPAVGVLVGAFFLVGVGLGVFTPANNAAVMGAVPVRRAGTAGGLVNMARALGTALGVAGVTLVLHLAGAGGVGVRFSSGLLGIMALGAGIVTLVGSGRAGVQPGSDGGGGAGSYGRTAGRGMAGHRGRPGWSARPG